MWLVESRTQANTVYRVDLTTQMCSCKNARNCWHLVAANVCDELRSMPIDQVLPQVTHLTDEDGVLDEAARAFADLRAGTPDDIDAFDWEALAAAQ